VQFHRNVVLWKYYKRSSNNDARLGGQVSLTCYLEPSSGAIKPHESLLYAQYIREWS